MCGSVPSLRARECSSSCGPAGDRRTAPLWHARAYKTLCPEVRWELWFLRLSTGRGCPEVTVAQLVAASGNGWLVLLPPAGGRQMARSWLAAFLWTQPSLCSLAGSPGDLSWSCLDVLGVVPSSFGDSVSQSKTHVFQACPWWYLHSGPRKMFLMLRSEPHSLCGARWRQGKYSALLASI